LPCFVVSGAVFFLRQIPVEYLEEEEAPESGYLPGAESPQAGQALLPRLAAVEEAGPPGALRGAEKLQPLSGGLLTQLQAPTRNTSEEVAGK